MEVNTLSSDSILAKLTRPQPTPPDQHQTLSTGNKAVALSSLRLALIKNNKGSKPHLCKKSLQAI